MSVHRTNLDAGGEGLSDRTSQSNRCCAYQRLLTPIIKEALLASYLVTEAAGFIGRSIAAPYSSRSESVCGIDNFITCKLANQVGLDSMEFIEGDRTDPNVYTQACKGMEIIFHEAALDSVFRSVASSTTTRSSGSRPMSLIKRNKPVVCFFREKDFSKVIPLI